MEDLIFDLVYEKVKDLPTKSQTKLLEGVQKDLFSLPPREQVGKVLDVLKISNSKHSAKKMRNERLRLSRTKIDLLPACPYFASKEYRPPSRLVPLSLEEKKKIDEFYSNSIFQSGMVLLAAMTGTFIMSKSGIGSELLRKIGKQKRRG